MLWDGAIMDRDECTGFWVNCWWRQWRYIAHYLNVISHNRKIISFITFSVKVKASHKVYGKMLYKYHIIAVAATTTKHREYTFYEGILTNSLEGSWSEWKNHEIHRTNHRFGWWRQRTEWERTKRHRNKNSQPWMFNEFLTVTFAGGVIWKTVSIDLIFFFFAR